MKPSSTHVGGVDGGAFGGADCGGGLLGGADCGGGLLGGAECGGGLLGGADCGIELPPKKSFSFASNIVFESKK